MRNEYAAVYGDRPYRCHQWRAMQKRSVRQQHRAGERLFIDYAGPTFEVIDGSTGEVRQVQVFVAVLGALSFTYAEATWSQWFPTAPRTWPVLIVSDAPAPNVPVVGFGLHEPADRRSRVHLSDCCVRHVSVGFGWAPVIKPS